MPTLIEVIKADSGPDGVLQSDFGETVSYVSVAKGAASGTAKSITAVISRHHRREGDTRDILVHEATLYFTGDATNGIASPSTRDNVVFDGEQWNVIDVGDAGPQSSDHIIRVERIEQAAATKSVVRRTS